MTEEKEDLLYLSKKLSDSAKKLALFVGDEYQSFLENDIEMVKKYDSNELFLKVLRFETDITSDKKELYKEAKGCKGIYIFRVKKTKPVNPFDFNRTLHGAPIRISNLKLEYFEKDKCLYLGKCKSLLTRMHSHFGDPTTNTGALRLSCKKREFMKDNVIVYCFVFKKTFNDFYDILAKVIEKELHNRLKPLTGKK